MNFFGVVIDDDHFNAAMAVARMYTQPGYPWSLAMMAIRVALGFEDS